MKILKISALVIFALLLFGCPPDSTPEPEPLPVCENLTKDTGEDGIDCGGTCDQCHDVKIEHELLIRHDAVVNSNHAKTGSLSFGKLMERLTPNSTTPQQLILSLVETWNTNQTSNGFTVLARPNVTSTIFNLWGERQGNTFDVPSRSMNLDDAPFRLLAITNRIDLNNLSKNSAGEGRLTFGLTQSGSNNFTLILEYKLGANSQEDIIQWTKKWHKLSAINDFNSPEYVDLVVDLVEEFTANGSMLNQIRTNEVIGGPWELREFNLSGNNFIEVSRKQSPDEGLQGTQALLNYVTDPTHISELANDTHTVKEEFNGQKFMAGNARYDSSFKWKLPNGNENDELKKLTELSCVGCHGGLRDDTNFTHIKPRPENLLSEISPFLGVDLLMRRDKIGLILEQTLTPVPPPNLSLPPSSPIAIIIPKILTPEEIAEIRLLIEGMSNGIRVH